MDKIKEKIQSLCPDVMELKRGCEIKWKDKTAFLTGNTYTMGDAFGSVPAKTYWITDREIKGVDTFAENNRDWEILGSPITLAVVLRAIRGECDKSCPKGHNPNQLFVTKDDWDIEVGTYDIAKLLLLWNLEHDNYDQQSEECKIFIGNLLGV